MSTVASSGTRLVRLAAAVASLLVLAFVLVGCSSSAEDASAGAWEPAAEPGREDEGADGGSDTGDSPAANRLLIVTGSMYMTVEKPLEAADKAAAIAKDAGGRVDAREQTAPDEWTGGSATLTLRIPTNRLDAVIAEVGALGTVDELATTASDVTDEVTDLDARISTLRASTQRIEALLVEAKDISDIIKLEDELASRQAELESLEAQQRGLTDQVSLSTITLSLTTVPVEIAEESPANFFDGLETGWNGLTAFVSGALVLFGVLLPWLLVMAAIGVVVVAMVRWRKSRAGQADAPEAAEEPAPEAATTK
jgi:hypothetical protein